MLFSVVTGLVGLSLSYAFALTATQVFLSRWYSSLANYIVSVERIKQYMHIPPGPPAIIGDKRPPTSWPPKGRIELLDLKVRNRVFLHADEIFKTGAAMLSLIELNSGFVFFFFFCMGFRYAIVLMHR